MAEAKLGAPAHVYVHVPFCGRRCSYCDFAIAIRKVVPVGEYIDAILAELVTRRVRLDSATLRSIYLGGGTPSKLGGDGISRLLAGIAQAADVDDLSTIAGQMEITVEANPEDVSPAAAAAWRAAGVNRVSLGVQSFDPAALAWMHREHGVEQVRAAVRAITGAGIEDWSLDLIFALPEELKRDWSRDLDLALGLNPTHLSLYGLTVEPHTPLGRWRARGEVEEAPEERYEQEFLAAHDRLAAAGFDHYEVSNFAKPGRRAVHNSSYWRSVPYLGLGPSAHGFDGGVRRWNRSAYADWQATVAAGTDPVDGQETIGSDERMAEEVYLGLRTTDGLTVHQNELKTVSRLIEAGWGQLDPDDRAESSAEQGIRSAGRLRLSPLGWLRLDSLAATLTSLRSRS